MLIGLLFIFSHKTFLILYVKLFFTSRFCLILAIIIKTIHIILHDIYEIISEEKLKVIHAINHIKIHILKSHPHNQLHHEISICKKKKINIQITQIKALQIAVCSKFMLKIYLIVQIIATIINNIIIS